MKIQAGKEKVTIIPAKLTRNAPGKSANQKLRVAAYCRVSTDSEEQINSYKNQLAYYTEKINSKTEWKFAGIYADEGITGTSMKHREDFKRMLRACREGRIDLILCKSVSRFGRNSVDVLRTIRALRERGIGVLFEKEAVDTRTMNSAPLPELMDRKKRDIMERKGDKEDENKRQKQQKESSAAAL